ncbi:hypothetical protein IGI04_020205 [Brassica rapa subsp. trilocularis]|uniref:Uncharacterized protein n=1 Tax=Brassica rapa subsp. trilocularis TaxID=1813537 RepID=A0ABQ7MLE9_BRACM|nr:hypothetical protein IGI04_020205 [Brassica rapa subsp. trilocularis]
MAAGVEDDGFRFRKRKLTASRIEKEEKNFEFKVSAVEPLNGFQTMSGDSKTTDLRSPSLAQKNASLQPEPTRQTSPCPGQGHQTLRPAGETSHDTARELEPSHALEEDGGNGESNANTGGFEEIPDNWSESVDIQSLREQIQILAVACLSESKRDAEIITPFKVAEVMNKTLQRNLSDNGTSTPSGNGELSPDGRRFRKVRECKCLDLFGYLPLTALTETQFNVNNGLNLISRAHQASHGSDSRDKRMIQGSNKGMIMNFVQFDPAPLQAEIPPFLKPIQRHLLSIYNGIVMGFTNHNRELS